MKKLYLILISVLLFTACKAPKEIIREVPVEVEKIVYKNVIQHDSIFVKDSVSTFQKGDTVFKNVIKYKYKIQIVYDSFVTHDTVPKIINQTEIQTIEKKVPQWWPVWLSGLIILILYILFLTYKRKFKK